MGGALVRVAPPSQPPADPKSSRIARGRREPGAAGGTGVPARSPWTRAEQETVIRWDEEEQTAHIYSASPKTWRKMARLRIAPVKETTVKGQVSGRFYRVPASQFRWRLKSEARAAANKGRRPGAPRA